MELQVPTMADVLDAREHIAPHLPRTPLLNHPLLDELLGTQTFAKHENQLPTGAFKVQGGVNLLSHLPEDVRRRGVICASSGNHGQSVAFAARIFGTRAIVCVPENANPVKVAGIEGLGAEIVFHGRDYDDARVHCEKLAAEHGYRYVHSGDEPLLIAGVATIYVEMLEDEPDLDFVFVPLGGGSSAAGACIVARAMRPSLRVIAVQSDQAPSAYRSWLEQRLIDDTTTTYAEGLATRTPFALPQLLMWELLKEFVLVTDDEIREAQALMIETTGQVIESAGAAPLAAALRMPDELRGKKVGLVASGGNVTPEMLEDVLQRHQAKLAEAADSAR
jgi:threonine dehydratase